MHKPTVPLLLAIFASACGTSDDGSFAIDAEGQQLVLSDQQDHRWVSRSMSAIWPQEVAGSYLSASWSEAEVKFVLQQAGTLIQQLEGALVSGFELRRAGQLVGRAFVAESREAATLRQQQDHRKSFNDFLVAVVYRNDGGAPASTEHCRPATAGDRSAPPQGCIWFTPTR